MSYKKGALWENFLVVERLKYLHQEAWRPNRKHQGAEIDYIVECDGRLSAYEFKWQNKLARLPTAFAEDRSGSDLAGVHRDNFEDFIGG